MTLQQPWSPASTYAVLTIVLRWRTSTQDHLGLPRIDSQDCLRRRTLTCVNVRWRRTHPRLLKCSWMQHSPTTTYVSVHCLGCSLALCLLTQDWASPGNSPRTQWKNWESCDPKVVRLGVTKALSCHYNLQCHQWRQICQIDDLLFQWRHTIASMMTEVFLVNFSQDLAGVRLGVQGTPYRFGDTFTADALMQLRGKQFVELHGERPKVPNYAVLITDGVSNIRNWRTIPEAHRVQVSWQMDALSSLMCKLNLISCDKVANIVHTMIVKYTMNEKLSSFNQNF